MKPHEAKEIADYELLQVDGKAKKKIFYCDCLTSRHEMALNHQFINVYRTYIEAIHCEWRSSVVFDVRHVGSPFTWG